VAWGGSTAAVNYHVFLPDQRWAYDLLVTRDGRSSRNAGVALEDYYAYGLPVYAPAAGVVFASHDGEPEVRIGQPSWGLAGLGNYIGVEVSPGEFLFIGHFQPGSVTVDVGDRVSRDQLIARVGNSGNSSEPHVHLHVQDSRDAYFGEGIPFYFHRYRYAGRLIERGMPEGGRVAGRYRGDRVVRVGSD
jgi:murein DD-endopeptidase MepM/ murein hydrolase activator NlpD